MIYDSFPLSPLSPSDMIYHHVDWLVTLTTLLRVLACDVQNLVTFTNMSAPVTIEQT